MKTLSALFSMMLIGLCTVLHAAPNEVNRSYKIPLLSVAADNAGALDRVEFSFSRTAAATVPLSIAIAEDTPEGAGESTRASVWMAAMVVALDRLDDLSGVKVTVQIPGQVDGPSAGGVFCLAFMCALDGRDFPADLAMTGTIMPDGTVGAVSGIVPKMRAAAKAGAKRFLSPAYVRFELDPKTNQSVDLKRLAASLHLEWLPVESITEAYRVAHGLPRLPMLRPDRSVLELPEATEELLKMRYRDRLAETNKMWNELPDAQKQEILTNAISRSLLMQPFDRSACAYRSGRLVTAADSIGQCHALLEAQAQSAAIMQSLKSGDFKKAMAVLDAKLQEAVTAVPTVPSLISTSRQHLNQSGIQCCADYYQLHGGLGVIQYLQGSVDQTIQSLGDPANQDHKVQGELQLKVVRAKLMQLQIALAVFEDSKQCVMDDERLAATLPQTQLARDAGSVERLFYSAYTAAHTKFLKDVIPFAAQSLRQDNDQALVTMTSSDQAFTMYLLVPDAMNALHKSVSDLRAAGQTVTILPGTAQARASLALDEATFSEAAAAHVYANSMAAVSGLITRWGELDIALDQDGAMRYQWTDLLNYLLTAAREAALTNIAECHAHNIPCIRPIYHFELAELCRDDANEDKVDVLTNYWNASLQAKVLLMLFTPSR